MRIKGKISIDVNDIIGKRLGKLEVVSYEGFIRERTRGSGTRVRHFYLCECDCGCTKVIRRGPLKNNRTFSCGCLRGKW